MLPLWTDSYLNDTPGLSLEEHGAYLKLLMIAWRSPACAIPNDDARICRMLGITPRRWSKLRPIVMTFWALDGRGWTQKRLLAEYQKATEKSGLAREAAQRRWDANQLNGHGSPDADAMPTQSEGISESNALSSLRLSKSPGGLLESANKPSRRKPEAPLPPAWVPKQRHRDNAASRRIDVDLEAEKFRIHAAQYDRRVRDWDAAFDGWLLKATTFAATRADRRPASIMDAAREVIAMGEGRENNQPLLLVQENAA